ncbi:MAG: tripartite tricarboxylate transporter substrate binding protein [Alphaproteobacteria bacterium]|nr:tripartite tricarboxylate transporter substrate binding protein [Alphaproteobacteria bacterium]
MHWFKGLIGIAGLLVMASSALAQATYPSRSVRWVVPFPPGGPTDTLSRILAAKLSEQWNQGVVVENKGGAAGAIGSDFVAKATPDGYTVILGTQSTHGSNAIFFPNMPFDPIKDFQPLTLIGTACLALVVAPNVPVSTPRALVEWIGKQNGAVAYASAAAGSSQHVAAELLLKRSGVTATHVPYRGSGAAQPDLMSGRVSFMFDNLPSALPLARAGKVKAIAQTCATRSPSAPELPTMPEAGFADFAIEGWYGIFAPAGTPKPIVDKLSDDINRVLRQPEQIERWKTLGFDPIGTTPEVFAARQKADLGYWKQMIEYTGVKVE